MVHNLSIDLETYSAAPIGSTGAYRYIEDPSFEILLLAYSLDGEPVQVIDMAQGDAVPEWLIAALSDPAYIKRAYNAAFEWACLSHWTGRELPLEQWRCTMLHGLYAGYTAGLEATGAALGLPAEKQKLATGKALIRYFCMPCKPTKRNGERTRNLPRHDPDKWALFIEYNRQDVVTEMEIERRLAAFPVPADVQQQWCTDMRINSRGVAVDREMVHAALQIGDTVGQQLRDEATRLTGLTNPNSVAQLRAWLEGETGIEIADLRKDTVGSLRGMLDQGTASRVLEIRQELGKTSNKKYDAIATAVCSDGRVRGLLQFYGANRTGRWAGRLVQVQNLPRTYIGELDLARELVKQQQIDGLRVVYGASINDTLSQLIRTAFVAAPGKVLIDADFSAIEARVISWLAGEQWRIKVFEDGGDIYCASASQMFGVPVEKHGVNGHLRQKGKVAELALGYQGGPGALIAMGALDMGLSEEELPDIVQRWRTANSKIRQLWWDMDAAATSVIEGGRPVRVQCLTLAMEYDAMQDTKVLAIQLPSGRKLYYVNPRIGTNRFGNQSIVYQGVNQTTKQWMDIETYGGKLIENCVQAIARDCLAQAIEKLEREGLRVVFHVHDEVCIEVEPFADNDAMLHKVVDIMRAPIPWAKGLPLNADGWVGAYFKKD